MDNAQLSKLADELDQRGADSLTLADLATLADVVRSITPALKTCLPGEPEPTQTPGERIEAVLHEAHALITGAGLPIPDEYAALIEQLAAIHAPVLTIKLASDSHAAC